MRLVTYERGGEKAVGLRRRDGISPTGYTDMVDLIRDGKQGLARAVEVADRKGVVRDARVVAPIRPGKLIFSGINYASHREENPDAVFPTVPFFFSKLPSAVIGPGEPIVIPTPETLTDYEVELALIVGRRAKKVSAADALDYVFGYTIAHDVSARDIQFTDAQLTLGKGVDTYAPLGPEIVTTDEIPDPQALHVRTTLNGVEMQSSPTSEMIFPARRILEYLTGYVTLEPGDLVTTGSPSGVGCFRKPPVYMKPGDEVTVEVDRIGKLTNPVVAGW